MGFIIGKLPLVQVSCILSPPAVRRQAMHLHVISGTSLGASGIDLRANPSLYGFGLRSYTRPLSLLYFSKATMGVCKARLGCYDVQSSVTGAAE